MTERPFLGGHPAYLRLGLSEEPKDATVPPYAPWRKLQDGPGWVIVVTGSLAGSLWGAVRDLKTGQRPSLWLLCELPVRQLPEEFQADLARSRRLLVVEEHVAHGGVAQSLASLLLASGQAPGGSPRDRPWAICRACMARRCFTGASVVSTPPRSSTFSQPEDS